MNVITNGLCAEKLLDLAKHITTQCKQCGVTFALSVSLDGVGPVNDLCRGVKGSFVKTTDTIMGIMAKPGEYCDSLSVGCTVSQYNVDHLVELDAFCQDRDIPVFYRLAVANRRIHTLESSDGFSVLSDESARQSAMEFFFGRIMDREDRDISRKLAYYAIFRYLDSHGTDRQARCTWQWRDATIDEGGNLYYCATQSKCLGRLNGENGKSMFFDSDNLAYRKHLVGERCGECIHYAFIPTLRGAGGLLWFIGRWLILPLQYRVLRKALCRSV